MKESISSFFKPTRCGLDWWWRIGNNTR